MQGYPDTDAMASSSHRTTDTALVRRPEWFTAFLAHRGIRKPSAHTMKAYRQDFDAIATLIAGADPSDLSRMSLGEITTGSMRTAFAQYAKTHEATLNSDLGVSHNLIYQRFGDKDDLWRASVEFGFGPLLRIMQGIFDPTLTEPLEQPHHPNTGSFLL
jgi:hypothetical protein